MRSHCVSFRLDWRRPRKYTAKSIVFANRKNHDAPMNPSWFPSCWELFIASIENVRS